MVCVYILRCNDNTYYTGISKDFTRRLKEHNSGKCRYTRNKLPLVVSFRTYVPDYKQAAKLERQIKNTGAKIWMLRNGKDVQLQNTGLKSFIVCS